MPGASVGQVTTFRDRPVVQLTDAICEHGEGPHWSDRWGALRVLDMLRGEVVQLSDDGQVARRRIGHVATLVRGRRHGGWVAVTDAGVLLADDDDLNAPLSFARPLWAEEAVRPNEGECAPDGSLYIGSMGWGGEPGLGQLLRLREYVATTELDSVTVSNGLGWSVDGRSAYYVDSASRAVDVFDWSPGEGLTNRRLFASTLGDGVPDGLCVDQDGGVWVAMYGGAEVLRFSSDGELAGRIALPVSQPTSVAFAGPHRNRLVVTTSQHDLASPEPGAGAIFEIVGHATAGAPEHEYVG